MKRFLLFSALFAFVFSAKAYDFIISNIAYSFDLYGTSVVVAPNTVTAYQGNIVIPERVAYNGVTYNVIGVGEKAFQNSSYLKSVTLPNSIKAIEARAFYSCTALTKINIPNAVTAIGDYAFYGCSVLADISIPNSVTMIGDYAFQNCKLLAEINIPNSVTEIGSYAFSGCSLLKDLTVPGSVKVIGKNAFYSCTKLENVTINEGVEIIGESAFQGCSILANVSIANSVTEINDKAFYNCSKITDINIPSSLIRLGTQVFYGMKLLNCAIYLPNPLEEIAASAFANVTLSDIYVAYRVPVPIDKTSFYTTNYSSATLHIPGGCYNIYRVAEFWNQFKNVVDDHPDYPEIKVGDVNEDGVVDVGDVNLITKIILER